MANVYLRIDKLEEVKGSATLEDIGGKKGWMPVDHMNFGLCMNQCVIYIKDDQFARTNFSGFHFLPPFMLAHQ